jgi:hypothetical protein
MVAFCEGLCENQFHPPNEGLENGTGQEVSTLDPRQQSCGGFPIRMEGEFVIFL